MDMAYFDDYIQLLTQSYQSILSRIYFRPSSFLRYGYPK